MIQSTGSRKPLWIWVMHSIISSKLKHRYEKHPWFFIHKSLNLNSILLSQLDIEI